MQWEVQLNSIRLSLNLWIPFSLTLNLRLKPLTVLSDKYAKETSPKTKKLRKITLAIRLERSSLTTSRNLLKSHILILLFPSVCKKKLFVQIPIRLMKRLRSSECPNQRFSGCAHSDRRIPRCSAKAKAPHIWKFPSRFKCLRNLSGEFSASFD